MKKKSRLMNEFKFQSSTLLEKKVEEKMSKMSWKAFQDVIRK